MNINDKSFVSLVKEIDAEYRVQRDRGTLFELLIKTYLENEPMYQRLFEEVWMLSEVPFEFNIPKTDTGVDLVAKKAMTGELVAIQCKYYSKDTSIRKEHIDSFLNEVGKNYYSEGLIVTSTEKWTKNADEALNNRDKNIMRLTLSQLKESRIDWSEFSFTKPKEVILQNKKIPRSHQIPAINSVIEGFENTDRGKLIMAPGTGKTFTSMAIAENMAKKTNDTFKVLYLVPSIQLLSQTLRSWNSDIDFNMDSIAVCSDRKVTKKRIGTEIEDIATADIGFPATTNTEKLLEYQQKIEAKSIQPEFISVFSTYQSIDVIIEAQENGFYEFDLIVCDEAHRTTGATELNQEASAFTKVHSNDNIKAKNRLYQTATPRVYGEDAKRKAEEKSTIIADMNDPETFGEELYRIGFGDAIRQGILTDYKVMVLAVDEDVIARRFQDMFSKTESGLQFDDVTKIIGCWNGLVKRDGNSNKTLGQPMKRAIAFTGTIKDSKKITNMFSTVVDEYLYKDDHSGKNHFNIDIQHADGAMNAIEKNEKIDWLKSEVPDNTCRVLSNARFLTEGVDVPHLDAVMFLKPRKSKIDIAQAVGRVMRKAEGKDYGYIILPIGVPAASEAHSILDNNEKYEVVWEILNALRSIDERFDATINKLELNKSKPNQIQAVGVGDAPKGGELEYPAPEDINEQLAFDYSEENLTDLERAIFGKIVQKVGNVHYWEQWSEDVAKIAQQHMTRINVMLEDKNSNTFKEFQKFMKSVRHNINDSISAQQAIEMLAQHLITKPIFEALFETYSFVKNNPVSQAMESILSVLDKQGLLKEQEKLEGFYESVRLRAEGIDNLKAKQDIIIQLYNKFFKVGFKETTDRLGIVFTPTEVVDFIIHSVDNVLQKHFSKSLSSKGVHVLDPFTGTGTFVARLLQSGLISKEDLLRKFTQEIHANEIVLLSYYIAAINIEETFHALHGGDYVPFEGIVLTDTFESTENKPSLMDELFNKNNDRLKRQQEEPIFVIMGNPPYSAGQGNENDNNKNIKHEILDKNIGQTYVKLASSKSLRNYYDSYIKAFRWATDRIGDHGVIGFVTNSSFIDKPVMDGIRKSFAKEFNSLYILNLRGAIRGRSGEFAKREGQNIFDIMTGVSISILVKDGLKSQKIFYKEVDDYLTRKEKRELLNLWKSTANIDWIEITPDENGDWINQRDKTYKNFTPLYNDKDQNESIFTEKTSGIVSNRDSWVYNFSKQKVYENTKRLISNYNSERLRLEKEKNKFELAERNEKIIKWTRSLRTKLEKNKEIKFTNNTIVKSLYRPFTKKYLNYDKDIIESARGYWKGYFEKPNIGIMISGIGSRKGFSVLAIDSIPSMDIMEKGQVFLLNGISEGGLFDHENKSLISKTKCKEFGLNEKEFLYYIYAILHSNDYHYKYKNDLIKGFPRIPKVRNMKEFIRIGEELLSLHLNYEDCPIYENVKIEYKSNNPTFNVQKKMKYQKRGEFDTIVFNSDITIRNIPEKAYEYVVNGRSAIDWIINQYQIKPDKNSGIIDDPNLYSQDEKYIFHLLLRVINVSVQTVDLVNALPTLEETN
ncbi:type ISP restriction/modification enzyme [Halobacillus sp. A5]|uniref:DEAD/DEAH box helicase n=1 Tax=Halobacillus sp. A5 TaxID=2880263 RepID=UPI0020A6AF27|nr:type ISP restriction/modification enzyme [Halobacillus sp. A5]MCP3028769.1 DEAD/DEAH box helicase family protein [Halobacillus sp. A5]